MSDETTTNDTETVEVSDPAAEKLYESEDQQAEPTDTETQEAEQAGETQEEPKGETEEKAEDTPEGIKLQLPEDSKLQDSDTEEVLALAKEKEWDQETAQKILDIKNQAVNDYVQRQEDSLDKKAAEWADLTKTDEEIKGSSDEEFNKNTELARRVLKRFGSEQLASTLIDTGLGNHPELVRMFMRIGHRMSDDVLVASSNQTPVVEKRAEEIMYPTMSQEAN